MNNKEKSGKHRQYIEHENNTENYFMMPHEETKEKFNENMMEMILQNVSHNIKHKKVAKGKKKMKKITFHWASTPFCCCIRKRNNFDHDHISIYIYPNAE